jgi:predicted membrane protein
VIDNERPGVSVTPQAVMGFLVILVGALLMAGNLGWVHARQVLSYWPVGVLLLGAAMFTRAADRSAKFSASIVIAVGIWLTLARILNLSGLSLSLIWPLVLVAIGSAMISRAWRQQGSASGVAEQAVSDFAFWSGIERKITSSVFRRADLTAIMGGIQVDLRQAGTSGEVAVLDVFIVMGGLEVRVPPDWAVSNQLVAIMGGASDKSTGTQDAKHRLVIRGFVFMGGVEVKT